MAIRAYFFFDFEPRLISVILMPGQFATVADGSVIAFAAAILERDDFLVLALLKTSPVTVAPSMSGEPWVSLSPSP